MENYIIIFCTTPTNEISMRIAEACINNHAAACCNILPGITSVYRWQGKVETDNEQLLLLKTTEDKFEIVENIIKKIHPYDVPEIVSVPINNGSRSYLQWINQI
jgi:periplasmic divalent cation tolerance protein